MKKDINKGLLVLVVVLSLLVLGLSSYLIYDKVLKEDKEIVENNNSEKEENSNKLSDDEALKLGEELYSKFSLLTSNKVPELNGKKENLNDWLVIDYSKRLSETDYFLVEDFEIKFNEIFSEKIEKDMVYYLPNASIMGASFQEKNGEYYIDFGGRCSGIPQSNMKIEVINIQDDRIEFKINYSEIYPAHDENDPEKMIEDKYSNDFVLGKEAETWKIYEAEYIGPCAGNDNRVIKK